MASEPMKASDKVLEIKVDNFGAREKVTLPDPVLSRLDPIQPVPEVMTQTETELGMSHADTDQSYMSSQSTVDPSNTGPTVITTAQVHVEAETKIADTDSGQCITDKANSHETASAPRGVMSVEEGHSQASAEISSQSLERLEKQVAEANERAAEREGDKVASETGGMNEPRESGSAGSAVLPPSVRRLAKQATLSPAGLLINTHVTEDSELSDSSKLKTSRPKGKKKKAKAKPNKPDTDQKEMDRPTTRSKQQSQST